MTRYTVSLILLLVVFTTGCDWLTFKRGNGEMVILTEYVDSFDEIVLAGNFEVFLDKSPEGEGLKVVVHVDENLERYVEIDSRGEILSVRVTEKVKSREGLKVFITFDEIERITSSGAAVVATEVPIEGEDLRLVLSGAGVMDLEVEVDEVEVKMSGAGVIKLGGKARSSDISLTGAGSLEAFDLESEDCEISISGVGGAQINVTGTLDASVSGVGGVDVVGNPREINRTVSGIGKIKEVDP